MRWMPIFMLICSVWFSSGYSYAAESDVSNIPLRAKYLELNKKLSNNQFQRALYLNSTESSHDLKGEIYAVVDYPFATVNLALNDPAHWCDVLILPQVNFPMAKQPIFKGYAAWWSAIPCAIIWRLMLTLLH